MSIQIKNKTIGLFGFGVVGEALYKVLDQTPSLNAVIKKVCIKDPEKPRNAPPELFTTDASLLLDDPEINIIVELISDANAAFTIISSGLGSGKAVVSANKKAIAEHLPELLALQSKHQAPFLYEAACCASIPVIRNLEEYYDNDLLRSINGIVNGSTNYILTKMTDEGIDFETALLQAQIEGFAESDPTLDVEGKDAVNKLCIILTHAYGIVRHPDEIVHNGITNIHAQDLNYAKEKGLKIKLVAHAGKLDDGTFASFVLPQFVAGDNLLSSVNSEYNGVVITSALADKQFFYGKGAGGYPTASAVLSDISALSYNYRYEYKKLQRKAAVNNGDFLLHVYASFNGLFHVPHELFERIDEWNSNGTRCFVKGKIMFSKLKEKWWKKNNVSLILLPEGISSLSAIPASEKTVQGLEIAYN